LGGTNWKTRKEDTKTKELIREGRHFKGSKLNDY
jgi:hypothetical protein